MNQMLKILLLEDIVTDAELVGVELRRANILFDLQVVDKRQDYIDAIGEYAPDVILSDHSLPSFNSLEALTILKESGLNVPFILVTGTASEEFAVNIMKAGAADYIFKDRLQRLPNAVLNAIEKFELQAESERAFRELSLLFNTIDEVFFSRDMINSKLLQISPACEKILGYHSSELLVNPELWNQIIYPPDRHIWEENYERLRDFETVICQYRITRKDQQVRWLESKIIPERNAEATLYKIYGVTRDITARKNDEEVIERNHQQLLEASATQTAILNALPPNIVLLNENGKIITVNESWRKFAILNNLGLPNYGIGYNYLAISENAIGIDKKQGPVIAKGIKDVLKGKKNEFSLEYECHSPSQKKYFQLIVAPIKDHTLKGVVVLHIDITDRKQAELSLLRSEDNLRSVFENTDLGVVLFDDDLKIVSANTNAHDLALTNFGKKIKTGSTAFNYFPKARKSFIEGVIERVNNNETVFYETVYEIKDGSKEWFDVKWAGLDNKKMETSGIILTLRNITEKKNAEIEREKITAELIRRNQDLEQFTYIISHNLRSHVANIKGLSGLLNCFEYEDAECSETMMALTNSVNNLDKVIIDLNQILQTGKQVNDKNEWVSLPSICEEIKSELQSVIVGNNATINCDFSIVNQLFTLKGYLYSIFQNLIVNSIKYRKLESYPVININSELKGDKAIIRFKDNGKGIDLSRHGEQLFGLYKRFDHTVEGKGMGLFMVKMQVESIGGTISVKSELGRGTEFKIELLTGPDNGDLKVADPSEAFNI
ncbi:PAS domain S-box protein [Mucilaginibacter xinganensis]|uniref:histidine kinase n=1 Tax=Mucilaginibacter xinganensis TaxID=1234841 RepID=A0A223NXM8_9SPHI|nr:PAS domain S-box protein [Mucilaginibacter xinganensis]ASU34576.1 hypothetical protein MuYL_2689 [Mucilaginibacter xinganensis]